MWYLYLVRCVDNTLYCGITKDLQRRLSEHNGSKKGARYTSTRRPVVLEYQEQLTESLGMALKRERQIKKLSRKQKEQMIEKGKQNG